MEIGKAKAEVAKLAKSKGIDVQSAWDIFFFDEVLLRLSKSKYQKAFVIKGGFYLQSIVGVETRSTMDIDLLYVEANCIYPIEVKKGVAPSKPTKNFSVLFKYKMEIKPGLVIDCTDKIRPINEAAYTFPVSLLGI